MDLDKLQKMNKLKDFMVKHSHKLDLVLGLLLLTYGIYGFYNNIEYNIFFIIAGSISLVMSVVKPVKLFDNYMNKKIIKKINERK